MSDWDKEGDWGNAGGADDWGIDADALEEARLVSEMESRAEEERARQKLRLEQAVRQELIMDAIKSLGQERLRLEEERDRLEESGQLPSAHRIKQIDIRIAEILKEIEKRRDRISPELVKDVISEREQRRIDEETERYRREQEEKEQAIRVMREKEIQAFTREKEGRAVQGMQSRFEDLADQISYDIRGKSFTTGTDEEERDSIAVLTSITGEQFENEYEIMSTKDDIQYIMGTKDALAPQLPFYMHIKYTQLLLKLCKKVRSMLSILEPKLINILTKDYVILRRDHYSRSKENDEQKIIFTNILHEFIRLGLHKETELYLKYITQRPEFQSLQYVEDASFENVQLLVDMYNPQGIRERVPAHLVDTYLTEYNYTLERPEGYAGLGMRKSQRRRGSNHRRSPLRSPLRSPRRVRRQGSPRRYKSPRRTPVRSRRGSRKRSGRRGSR